MPLRFPKMNFFILGFHRFVWCPKCTPASDRRELETLPLAELEPGPRAALAVLLAFLHPRVARQKALFLELLAELRVVVGQRPRDPVANRPGLSRSSASPNPDVDVELLRRLDREERLLDDHLQDVVGKVVVEAPRVDRDRSGAGDAANARHRSLPAAGGLVLDFDRQLASVRRGAAVRPGTASAFGICASCGCEAPL